jgi:hypothetical protein
MNAARAGKEVKLHRSDEQTIHRLQGQMVLLSVDTATLIEWHGAGQDLSRHRSTPGRMQGGACISTPPRAAPATEARAPPPPEFATPELIYKILRSRGEAAAVEGGLRIPSTPTAGLGMTVSTHIASVGTCVRYRYGTDCTRQLGGIQQQCTVRATHAQSDNTQEPP